MRAGDDVIDWLHTIRKAHWRETRHLSAEEFCKRLETETAAMAARLGLETAAGSVPVRSPATRSAPRRTKRTRRAIRRAA